MTDSNKQLEALRRDTLREFTEVVLTTGSVPVLDGTVVIGNTESRADDAEPDAETVQTGNMDNLAEAVSTAVSEHSAASPADEDCLHDVTVLARKLKV